MRIKRTIEEIIELAGSVNLESVNIDGKTYELSIENSGNEQLSLKFSRNKHVEYTMQIGEKGIIFDRHVYRPNHDYDDTESLQITNGEGGTTQGKILWNKHFPHKGRGYDFFEVPFGPKKVNY